MILFPFSFDSRAINLLLYIKDYNCADWMFRARFHDGFAAREGREGGEIARNWLRKIKILDGANRNAPDPREDLDTIISHGLSRGSLDPAFGCTPSRRFLPFHIDIDRQPAGQEETARCRRRYKLLHRISAMGDPYCRSEKTVSANRFKRDRFERIYREQIGRSI